MPVTHWHIFWIWYYLDNKLNFCYNRIDLQRSAERINEWQLLNRVKFAIFVLLHI